MTVCKHWFRLAEFVRKKNVYLQIFAEQKYRPRLAYIAGELTSTWRNIINVPISNYLCGGSTI